MKTKFTKGSPSRFIMCIALYTGCFYYPAFHFIRDNPRSYHRTAQSLIEDGFLEERKYTHNRMKYRILVPTSLAINLQANGEPFFENDMEFAAYNLSKLKRNHTVDTEKSIRTLNTTMRYMSISAVTTFFYAIYKTASENKLMQGMNTQLLPGYKAKPDKRLLNRHSCAIYTPYEVKVNMSPEKARSCNGRSHAYIVNSGKIYSVIYIKDYAQPNIKPGVEFNSNLTIRNEFKMHYIEKGIASKENATIILAKYKTMMCTLMYDEKKNYGQEHKLWINTASDKEEYLFIPSDREGELLLALLFSNGSSRFLKEYHAPENRNTEASNVVNDYYSKETYYLSFLIPDLYRLKLFLSAAELRTNEKFRLIAFDIYKSELEQLTKNLSNLKITYLKLDKVVQDFTKGCEEHETN